MQARQYVAEPFEELSALDRLIHEPARLAILTALASCRNCDFLFLQSLTGLTKGNLSNHLMKLEEAGLLEKEKRFKGLTPRTLLRLTREGRNRVREHWKRLSGLRRAVDQWRLRHQAD
jgi:DNA-binding transcriptional ArsR family regulator